MFQVVSAVVVRGLRFLCDHHVRSVPHVPYARGRHARAVPFFPAPLRPPNAGPSRALRRRRNRRRLHRRLRSRSRRRLSHVDARPPQHDGAISVHSVDFPARLHRVSSRRAPFACPMALDGHVVARAVAAADIAKPQSADLELKAHYRIACEWNMLNFVTCGLTPTRR
jgi:hypothetical protein